MHRPEIFVLGGPNGAGKTTVASKILPKRFPASAFINADEITESLGSASPLDAGRIVLQQMHDARRRRETFAFETTLAARSHVRFLRDARSAGYFIHIAYLWLSSVDLATHRVAVRVLRGGHQVAAVDIERRYWRGLCNFFELYQPLADRWVLCDNSGRRLVLVARGRNGGDRTIYDEKRFDRIRDAAQQHRRRHT